MRVAETMIKINAPVEKVWDLVLNTDEYPRWNSFVIKAERQGDVKQTGTKMKLFVRWKDGGKETSDEIIEQAIAPKIYTEGIKRAAWSYRFNGKLSQFGLLKAVRFHWMEQKENEPTTYRTREEFKGLLSRFVPLKKVQEGFVRQTADLKRTAEATSISK